MSLLTEVLLVSGVAMDLGGEADALATHAQLLAEKRIGFLLLTLGLIFYLCGIVLKSSEGPALMGAIAGGVAITALVTSLVFTRTFGARIREQARQAAEQPDTEALPEQ